VKAELGHELLVVLAASHEHDTHAAKPGRPLEHDLQQFLSYGRVQPGHLEPAAKSPMDGVRHAVKELRADALVEEAHRAVHHVVLRQAPRERKGAMDTMLNAL
jgi:hypothetical protein